MEETKVLEILVVEDDPKHLAAAKAEMERRIGLGTPIKVHYASTLKEAQECIGSYAIDGVISDVFFPSGLKKSQESKIRKPLAKLLRKAFGEFRGSFDLEKETAIQAWEKGHDLAPLGVHLAETYQGPLVFCTSTFHHGSKSEPVFRYAGQKKITMVDRYLSGGERDKEAAEKRWDQAYLALIDTIVVKKMIGPERLEKDDPGQLEKDRAALVKPYHLDGDQYVYDSILDKYLKE